MFIAFQILKLCGAVDFILHSICYNLFYLDYCPGKESVNSHRKEKVDSHRKEKVDSHKKERVDSREKERVDSHEKERLDSHEKERLDSHEKERVDSHEKEREDSHEKVGVDSHHQLYYVEDHYRQLRRHNSKLYLWLPHIVRFPREHDLYLDPLYNLLSHLIKSPLLINRLS